MAASAPQPRTPSRCLPTPECTCMVCAPGQQPPPPSRSSPVTPTPLTGREMATTRPTWVEMLSQRKLKPRIMRPSMAPMKVPAPASLAMTRR
ncbi:hypothetical protein F751_2764 [Auxenochlorella protothecoides]|uniref:Uncharacterized protein n=1 Tax=Auxenochlorella protothecoides TaxID=3075 RepID=A0A087SPW9_AUXPR|nr:hypothetical protein F751_2764 [Auxenochlorella protothecoides]KFM27773.1 hypothetical protein F751_2764 [Auxenochlorella protothecoides]